MKITAYDPSVHGNPDEHGRAQPPHGAYTGMPSAAYHDARAISRSDLRAFAADPRTFLKTRTPQGIAVKREALAGEGDSEALRIGTYLHIAMSSSEAWSRYAPLPQGTVLNEAHGKIKAWRAANPGITPVRAKEHATVTLLADALRADDRVADILSRVIPGVAIFWRDVASGLEMKAEIDFYDPAINMIYDLKSTRETSIEGWQWAAQKHGYDAQAAHYLRAVKAMGEEPAGFVFIVVMKEPYDPGIFLARFSEETLAAAGQFLAETAQGLGMMGDAVPALPRDVVTLDLPREDI